MAASNRKLAIQMQLAMTTAKSPAMPIAAPQATFVTLASTVPSPGAQVRGSSSGGGMGRILARFPTLCPGRRLGPSACRFQVAGQPLPRLTFGNGPFLSIRDVCSQDGY